jgi:hypothetical protein
MIVRRLCVTPAVGSLMQWLLTRRNRTTERTNRATARQQHEFNIHLKEYRMSQEICQTELKARTQQLVDGPLKHIRAAALAAALLPLASVAAAPASAQDLCQASGGTAVCGFIWDDTNNNGVQDAGEPAIEGAKVFLSDGTDTLQVDTGPDGFFNFVVPEGPYTLAVQIPTGTQPSSVNAGDDTLDSDGVSDGLGFSVSTVTVVAGENNQNTDFGFVTPAVQQPGTGTPGYWKNHPEAWPQDYIVVGGTRYSKDDAIALLKKVGKDKTTTMFSSLVPAILNVMIKNDGSCVSSTIADAHQWMVTYGPVGSGVAASSYAWSIGEPMHRQMDYYNNGLLCAPHRQ